MLHKFYIIQTRKLLLFGNNILYCIVTLLYAEPEIKTFIAFYSPTEIITLINHKYDGSIFKYKNNYIKNTFIFMCLITGNMLLYNTLLTYAVQYDVSLIVHVEHNGNLEYMDYYIKIAIANHENKIRFSNSLRAKWILSCISYN